MPDAAGATPDEPRNARETRWASWMRAALAGEEASYRRLLGSLAPHLRAAARRRIAGLGASSVEPEDVVQEALLTIHLKRSTWDPGRPIGPWIAAILRHKILDACRRGGHRVTVPLDDVARNVGGGERPDDGLDRRDLERLLGRLNDRRRKIVRLVSVEGLSAREAALSLDMSEGALRVALHRALRCLASLYREEPDETDGPIPALAVGPETRAGARLPTRRATAGGRRRSATRCGSSTARNVPTIGSKASTGA